MLETQIIQGTVYKKYTFTYKTAKGVQRKAITTLAITIKFDQLGFGCHSYAVNNAIFVVIGMANADFSAPNPDGFDGFIGAWSRLRRLVEIGALNYQIWEGSDLVQSVYYDEADRRALCWSIHHLRTNLLDFRNAFPLRLNLSKTEELAIIDAWIDERLKSPVAMISFCPVMNFGTASRKDKAYITADLIKRIAERREGILHSSQLVVNPNHPNIDGTFSLVQTHTWILPYTKVVKDSHSVVVPKKHKKDTVIDPDDFMATFGRTTKKFSTLDAVLRPVEDSL